LHYVAGQQALQQKNYSSNSKSREELMMPPIYTVRLAGTNYKLKTVQA
jgi:hypothetical protein